MVTLESEWAVAHAAGGGQGGDGGGEDGDNHLNGLALDGLPCLFLQFIPSTRPIEMGRLLS